MYPKTCLGGFFNPATAVGKTVVVGIQGTIDDLTADARLALIDDPAIKTAHMGFVYGTDPANTYALIDIQAQADQEGNIECWFPEPITFRYGISVGANSTNIELGSMKVFVR